LSGATPLGNMVIKLGLDDADFGRGVANSKKQVSYLAKEMSANMKIADMAGNKLGKLGTRYDSLTKIIGAQENQVKDLKKAYEDSFVDGKATEQTKRLAAQLQDANGKLANYKIQLQRTAGAMAEYKIRNEGFTGAVNKASDSLLIHGKRLESTGSAMTKGLTLPLIAGAAAVTTAAISWESGFAGVLKTNDEIVDKNGKVVYSFKDLEKGLRNLSKELPASHKEIAATAEAAGQLGIQTDNVVGFTKTMIDLGESTNMSAESAATSLARFANITQMSQKDFDKLGSVVVDLGNNFATTEQEIVDMGLRLAGAGKQIGMSEGEIMGFAAALSSVGIEAEAGGSAFSKVMINMQLATEKGIGSFDELISMGSEVGLTFDDIVYAVNKGGKPLKNVAGAMGITTKELNKMYKEADKSATSLIQFSDVAGMTNAEFANLFKTDPSKAIMKFVEGLSKAEKQGKSAIRVLDDMDITEVRLRDSLLRAANASGVFEGAVKKGNKAWKENTALTEEANKRYETTESKLKMLKNEVVDTAIDLGGPFVDALREGLEASKPLIKGLGELAKSFNDADPKTQKMILGLLGATAASGPLLSILGKTATTAGGVGKSFVELSAEMAKKKAITEVTKAFTDGNVSAGDLLSTLSSGTGTVTNFGGAMATASGAKGIGAMATALGPLGPAILGIVGVGGALAIGYGAWKLWGEEAYNSAQRTKEWGVDVGKATGEALTIVKSNTQEANGEWALLEQGVDGNSAKMIANFEAIGKAIETDLVNQINTFKEAVNLMPEEVQKSAQEIVDGFAEEREKALKIAEENNDAVLEIKKKYTDESGNVTAQGAKMISDLMKQSTSEYLKITIKDADQRKKVLDSMTGDVESASEDQAKTWLQNLGKQRAETKNEYNNNLKDFKKYLKDKGQLDTDEGQQLVKLFEKSAEDSTLAIDKQMALISEKYPELKKKVIYENGMLASELGGMAEVTEEANNILLEKAGAMSEKLANNSKKTADTLKWVADQGTDAGKAWNSLELLDKEGKVKSNAAEIVTEATKETAKWNEIRMVLHDADLDSNAKKVVGEAAIANGWWDGMAWKDKEAVLQDEFSINMYKALDSSGKWQEMSLEEKKAILYSNTPEIMADTMLKLGLWDDYEAEIKDLDADNFNLLKTVSKSEESLKTYNNLDPDFKELLAKDPSTMTFNESKKALEEYNKLDEDFKKLLGENTNVNNVISKAEEKLNAYEEVKPGPKRLAGDASSVTSATSKGGSNLDNYSRNNPGLKMLRGDESSVRSATQSGGSALSTYSRNNPNRKYLNATDNASRPAGNATKAVETFGNQRDKKVTLTTVVKNVTQWITEKFTKNATGTNYHPGGLAMVNDQRGAMYRELVQHPTGEMYIPQGRNVMLDLPRGSKVYTAAQTKQMVPKYAEGVGIPKNSTLVRNLEAVNREFETTTVIQNDNSELVDLMGRMLNIITKLKPEVNIYEADKRTTKELVREIEKSIMRGV